MNKPVITFDEVNHLYTVNGKKAISVTTFLKAIGISADVSTIPKHILEGARQRGNYYDKLAEEAINDPFELNDWQERFLKVVEENNLSITKAQNIYGIEEPIVMAGTGDFEGVLEVDDLKATSEIYITSVTWQTNLYSWMKDREKHKDFKRHVIHYNEKDDRFTVLKLDHIPEKNILFAIECYQLGDLYTEGITEENGIVDIQAFSKLYDNVAKYKKILKEEEDKLKKFDEEIMENMAKANIKTFELENFKFTRTPPTERKTVNYSAIAEEKNIKEMNKVNEFLVSNGMEPLKIYTTEEIKETATQEEIDANTKIANVKQRLTITPKKK